MPASDEKVPAATNAEKDAVLEVMRAYGHALNASGVALGLAAIGQVKRCELILDALNSDGKIELYEHNIPISGIMYVLPSS